MASRFDLDVAGCAAIGIDPWFYCCSFKIDLQALNADGTPRNLTGATFRFTLAEGEFSPTLLLDFERAEGQSGNSHINWLDPVNGLVRVEFGVADVTVTPKLGRWWTGMLLFSGGTPRTVVWYGKADTLVAPPPSTAVDPAL